MMLRTGRHVQTDLAYGFVESDCDRVGQVQAASFGPHRNAHRAVSLGREPRLWQPAAFGPKDQGVAVVIGGGRVQPGGLGAERPEPAAVQQRNRAIEVVDDAVIEVLPIIETSPPEMTVVEVEPERPHEPETSARGHARPADRTHVGGDLGLDQHDVEHGPNESAAVAGRRCWPQPAVRWRSLRICSDFLGFEVWKIPNDRPVADAPEA